MINLVFCIMILSALTGTAFIINDRIFFNQALQLKSNIFGVSKNSNYDGFYEIFQFFNLKFFIYGLTCKNKKLFFKINGLNLIDSLKKLDKNNKYIMKSHSLTKKYLIELEQGKIIKNLTINKSDYKATYFSVKNYVGNFKLTKRKKHNIYIMTFNIGDKCLTTETISKCIKNNQIDISIINNKISRLQELKFYLLTINKLENEKKYIK